MSTNTTLRQLLVILNDSVAALEERARSLGLPLPDLNNPFSPPSEAFRGDPACAEAASRISAAALHLEAIFTPPQVSLYHVVAGHFKSAALQVCLESHVTEILREAGPQGLHINDIAAKNGQDPLKLARFIRYLAVQHIYREVSLNVFANTRISSMMDTLKSSAEIIANPDLKHDGTPGLAALASHHLDEAFKASAYAWDTLANPKTVKSDEPNASPFNRAFNTQGSLWDLYARDERRQRRFNIGMQGIQSLQPADAILKSYEWATLSPGSTIVDVGGGVGTSSLVIAKNFPELHIVVQDLDGPISDARELWAKELPNANITLEVQDFFKLQPRDHTVSIFLLKQIMHDWSDSYCVKILTQLRSAASANTKLILVESIIPFACHDSGEDSVPGAVPHEAPEPLLANYGAVNEMAYSMDIGMFLHFNSQERTIRHMQDLLLSTGWKVVKVRRQDGDSTFLQAVEAVPVEV
ncbi:S-adenosyl-L-methionine-dependent methyltransferase [Hymenopellis radicata]|nr:S-adenosyl-L-methionine-dependent methyltransferase [Hymenopellis radicata]